jgi:Protein of unknown function (DUF3455)
MAKVLRLTVLALLALAFVAPVGADPGNDNRAPVLEGDCKKLQVEEGNKVAFQASAVGVQIYAWNGVKWVFVAPSAILYHGNGVVATHYAGPTWESNSGSTVVGARIDGSTPDPTAIPWLLLKAVETEGPGIFDGITFIQRINTVGGLAPSEPGEFVGEIVEVPYLADYVFYRKQ